MGKQLARGALNKALQMKAKKRIGYIDAMRGFTIMLVVLQHVVSICYEPEELHTAYQSLQQVRMPLFFLISGFLFFKTDKVWNPAGVAGFLKKKVTVQILSPTIFMLLYFLYMGIGFKEGILNKSKCGYWFTYTLFQFFIIFITTQVIFRLLKLKDKYYDTAILLSGFLVCIISLESTHEYSFWNRNLTYFLGTGKWDLYIFFVIGTVVKKYFTDFEKLLKNKLTLLLCALLLIVININRDYLINLIDYYVLQFACGTISILFLFSIFRNLENQLSQERRAGKIMQFIGCRTLDIYLIHFFLVYSEFGRSIIDIELSNNILQIIYIIFITTITVALALFISSILRLNTTVGNFLFGSKKTMPAVQTMQQTAKG